MDIILDSNIFLSDIRLAKAGFEGLFAYLRRTGNHLVIPEVVFQEVLARHKDRLSDSIDRANSSWNNVRHWQLSDGVNLPEVDVDAASKALFARLNQPTKWVKSIRYDNSSKITPMDVALRGINRLKPASAEGEQLRDVLLWMQLLEYAQESDREIAFITQNKKDFCGKDGSGLHPDLVQECAKLGIKVHFYFDIVEFLREHSLAQSPFSESQLPPELTFTALDSKLAFNVANERTTHGYPDEFRVLEIAFKSGTLFKISEVTSIAELSYAGKVMCKFKQPLYTQVLLQPFPQQPASLLSQAEATKKFIDTLKRNYASHSTRHADMSVMFTVPPEFEEHSVREQLLNFHAMVSARFNDNKLVSWDVESFKLLDASSD